MKHLPKLLSCVAVLGGLHTCPARADVFRLDSGGEVHGELVNPDQDPRTTYVVKTPSGGQVTLTADQVKKVESQSDDEIKYDQIRARVADTVADQWKLAEWCREHRLYKQRRTHLERIVELEPNHAQARHGLGYSQIRGRWVTQETAMTENGYVRYKGAWLLPQEIEIKERERKEKLARLDWARKLKRWHGWLNGARAGEAISGIQAIKDPFAADALARHLNDPKVAAPRRVRLLYVEALARLESNAGMNALVDVSLYDADEEVRLLSIEQLASHRYSPAIKKYTRALRNQNNAIVNQAAIGLAHMKDPSATVPLIDALVTEHTFTIQKGQPGQTSATFGTGGNTTRGGGFSFGGSSTETVKRSFQNRNVLDALVALTGKSFGYDQYAWKRWYASQRAPSTLDARRDEAPR